MESSDYVISDEAFILLRDRALLIARFALDTPPEQLDSFLTRCAEADALGPMLNPTLYIRASGAMRDMVAIVGALRDYRAELSRFEIGQPVNPDA